MVNRPDGPAAVRIVAEIGNTHEGSMGLARCFIAAAADCGADAVKFQTHIFEAESLPTAPAPPYFQAESREAYFRRTAFDLAQHRRLKAYAEETCGVEFLSSPFSLEAVALLERVGVAAYKIASGEVTNRPLLEAVAATGRAVLLSSGMSRWAELDAAVATLREGGCPELTVLQCTSRYPCPPEKAGLNLLGDLRRRYGLPVGLSDHTRGDAIAVAAVACGARVIEKHFTLSRRMYGPDAATAMEPRAFRRMVARIREVERALAHPLDKDAEAGRLGQMKTVFEKSVVAACDLAAGTVLERRHLAFKKPGDGISARHYRRLLGVRLDRPVARDTPLRPSLLGDDPPAE